VPILDVPRHAAVSGPGLSTPPRTAPSAAVPASDP